MIKLVNVVGYSNYLLGLIFFIIPFILTQFMSNRGTMLIFHPIAIATCASMGGNPVGLMILIQAACLSAFMTPMSTSATPYIMGLGWIRHPKHVQAGYRLCRGDLRGVGGVDHDNIPSAVILAPGDRT